MKSPFPGMDPYIEACDLWGDFHFTLVGKIKDALARSAPEPYTIRLGVRSYEAILKPGEEETCLEQQNEPRPAKRRKTKAAPPFELRAFVTVPYRETFVEIHDTRPEPRLVTCIEILSPSNKLPDSTGWNLYQEKRRALLLGYFSLVEVDLLRGGSRMPMYDPWPDLLFSMLVARPDPLHRCFVWPGHYRTPLPVIPVPLSRPDPDLSLDLQPLLDEIYEVSRYADTIDYTKPLSPALTSEDANWLKRRLRELQAQSGD